MVETRIPITFIGEDGAPTSDRIRGCPVVPAALIDYGDGVLPPIISARQVPALIDTGADWVYADPKLLSEAGTSPHFDTDVNNENNPSGVHRCYLFVGRLAAAFQMAVISRNFTASRNPYPLVLGRAALLNFELRMGKGHDPCYLVHRASEVASGERHHSSSGS